MLNPRKSPKYYFDTSTGIERKSLQKKINFSKSRKKIRADEILTEIVRFFQYILKAWKPWNCLI